MKKRVTLESLVKSEAKKLRTSATPAELSNLNFSSLNPRNTEYCIYGQMTKSCYSIRANTLVKKCAKRVYINIDDLAKARLNGKPVLDNEGYRSSDFFSPIEKFIVLKRNQTPDENGISNNARLISYLKGETKKLVIKR